MVNLMVLLHLKVLNNRKIIFEHFSNPILLLMDLRLSFLMCETLNFLTVIRQLYFIDSLFGADFAMHGWKVLELVMI